MLGIPIRRHLLKVSGFRHQVTGFCFSREMAVAANRRSIDDHIVILGWISEEHQHEALNIELNNDSWIPRIELQGYCEDPSISASSKWVLLKEHNCLQIT